MAWNVSCSSDGVDGPVERNKTIVQGDSWEILVTFDEVIDDLVVYGSIKDTYVPNETTGTDIVGTKLPDGSWKMLLQPGDSLTLDPDIEYVYDLEYSIPSRNVVTTFLRGKVTILGQVSNVRA
jgi:hypothetical protein